MMKKYVSLQKRIDQKLDLFFNEKIKAAKKISPFFAKLIKEKRDFVMAGGKRIRPVLFYIGYVMAGGKNKKAALNTSCCIELIHNYLLVHDDIIDQDVLRRNKPTLHIRYAALMKNRSSLTEHLGISFAIVGADILAAYGYEVLTNAPFSDDKKLQAIKVLNKILSDVTIGQDLDILYSTQKNIRLKESLKVAEYKTGKYTIEGPLKLGALLAGANKKTLTLITNYAKPLGIAFQIHDDILGMFGNKKKTGKSSDSDIKQHKQNLLLLYAKQRASSEQKKVLNQIRMTPQNVQHIKKIVKKTGSLDYAQILAKKLANQAKAVIQESFIQKETGAFLIELADYIITRES